ncbi:hypothetical protein Tco_1353005 [Tanacetum coccineum]
MEELYQPTMNGWGRPIAPINIQATDFELKNHMIQKVQNSCQFHGLSGDDANKHLDKFLTITQSMKQNGEIDLKFLSKYFPPSMVTKLRNDISNFRQLLDESLFEAWERYKLLIGPDSVLLRSMLQQEDLYDRRPKCVMILSESHNRPTPYNDIGFLKLIGVITLLAEHWEHSRRVDINRTQGLSFLHIR